ncbi:MAG: hypothetical protein M1834_007337 [Cirrosporium novae-zelandiae]|nr:MAG: hypothetical protein M1834_007337 [Cirrosporium novae-zelandiae]
MSATINPNATAAVSNQQGQFASHIPPSEPMETKGVCPPSLPIQSPNPNPLHSPNSHPAHLLQHQPGRQVGNEAAPSFQAQTLPAGTAPAEHTFQPDASSEVLAHAPASSTLAGATSADVHTGYGHPGSGQTSSELHHDGAYTRTKQGGGLQGVGASGVESHRGAVDGQVDER